MQGLIIIFGSYAKGIQKDDSDLDLFIVGKYKKSNFIPAIKFRNGGFYA
jgi:predicted nucleotidyltransferase